VRALARSESASRRVTALGAEPVRGDLRDASALEAGLSGCEVVYHAAGVNAFCLPDPRPMFEVNVAGSRAVVLAAAAAGVSRLVYTSSAATLDVGMSGADRAGHRSSRRFLSNYARSKYEAEHAVMDASASTGLPVVCVNPASVQGPGRTSGTARLLIGYLNGKLPAAVDGPLNVIDIADCTRGHLLAEEQGVPGERYLLCGASMTLRGGLALLSRLTGLDDPPRFLPPRLALAAAACIEVVARARGKHARFCREMVRTLIEGAAYDGSQATRDLGLDYTPIEVTMRRTISWYLEQGLILRPLPGFTGSGDGAPKSV
jgi:dihydroflavonol-4-reductase